MIEKLKKNSKIKNIILLMMVNVLVLVSIFLIIAKRPLISDAIIILYTNDVHCGIDANIGYAGLVKYKEEMEEQTPYVTLVDCGDAIQGEYIGLVSEGAYIAKLMNGQGTTSQFLEIMSLIMV